MVTPLPQLDDIPAEVVLRILYGLALDREPDETGRASYLPGLERGDLTPQQVLQWLVTSDEWRHRVSELGPSLHQGRGAFIRSLPPARRILDLGGTALGSREGAIVRMGYPYRFERLTVVDLPPDARHEIYREQENSPVVDTHLGPVHYEYHSMIDLSRYETASVDLVVSGESIEHVTWEEADRMLGEVWRVLRPGGYLALDTPNARVTRVQQPSFVDPDHKYEYTPEEMSRKLRWHGFDIVEAKGIGYAGPSVATGTFSEREVAANSGLYWDVRNCYLLAYLCRRPPELASGPARARRAVWRSYKAARRRYG